MRNDPLRAEEHVLLRGLPEVGIYKTNKHVAGIGYARDAIEFIVNTIRF